MLKPFRAKRVYLFSTLSFQFAGATAISSQITFTRASTGTYFNAAGTLTSAAINEPRLDYNPSTLAAQGLLIEEARTNSIRNNTMVGAVAGTPGTLPTNWFLYTALTGLTTSVVSTGVENGVTYLDIRVSGTPSAVGSISLGFEGNTSIAASNAQTWSQSAYLKLQAGSFTGVTETRLQSDERSSSAYIRSNNSSTLSIGSAALNTQRFSYSYTLSGGVSVANIVPYVLLSLSGAAIDITLRIGLPQLEQGAFATSVIPTTTIALTRAADVASVNTLSPWFNASEGTLFAEFAHLSSSAALFPRVAALDDTTANNAIRLGVSGVTAYSFAVAVGGVLQASLVAGTVANNTTVRSAGAYKVNEFQMAANGLLGTLDTSGTLPTVSQLTLGSSAGGNFLNGYLRRVSYFPRRLSDAELISLTT